jgi:hypothetical protein
MPRVKQDSTSATPANQPEPKEFQLPMAGFTGTPEEIER